MRKSRYCKESTPEGRGIGLPLEGAVGYTKFKVTKVSKVTKVKEFCLFYKKDGLPGRSQSDFTFGYAATRGEAWSEATPQL